MKEIGTCKECRFQAKSKCSPDAAINDNFRYEEIPDLKSKVGSCRRRPELHQDNWIAPPPSYEDFQSGAWVDYDTIEHHFIEMTGPDFGCIHWEGR